MNLDHLWFQILGKPSRIRKVETVIFSHEPDQERFPRMAHMGADDGEVGEVDQNIIEKHWILIAESHFRPRHPHVYGHRQPQAFATLVDRVQPRRVDLLVDRYWRDADQYEVPLWG